MPPANDNFANATDLGSAPGSIAGDTFDATQEASEPNWFLDWSAQSVWYKFTPSASGVYRFRIQVSSISYTGSGSGSHLMLAVADDASIDTVAEFDDDAGTIDNDTYVAPGSGGIGGSDDLIVVVNLSSGSTYYIRVSSNRNSGITNRNVCSFTLEHELIPPPDNDDFADAEIISGESGSTTADTTGASVEGSEPPPYYWSGSSYPSIWYEWTAPSSGRYRFQAGDSDHNVALAVYTGASLGSLTPISKNDGGAEESGSYYTVLGFIATANTTYKIQVSGYNPSSSMLVWSKEASTEGLSQGTAIELLGRVVDTIDNLGFDGTPPSDIDSRFSAFTGYTGGNTYIFGRPKWYHVDSSDYGTKNGMDIRIKADGGSGFAAFAVFVYDGALNPRNNEDGFDAVAVSEFDGGLRIPTSSTNFSSASANNELVVEVPQGEEAYIVLVGFVVEEYAIPDSSVISDADISQWEVMFTLIAEICVLAKLVINPDSTTASIVDTNYVRESNIRIYQDYTHENEPSTLKWAWEGAPGTYEVGATGKAASTPTGTGRVRILLKRNGYPFLAIQNDSSSITDTNDHNWKQYAWDSEDYGDTGWDPITDGAQYPYVMLKTGDEIEVTTISFLEDGSFNDIDFDLRKVCFTLVDANTDFCTGLFDFPAEPLGDAWGSEKGWGGQKLVPDQIFVDAGITPYDEGNFAWGVNYTDNDMCVLDDGTVYVIFKEAYNVGSGTPTKPTNYKHYVVIKKYDPDTDDWSQVAYLNDDRPATDQYDAGAVSCITGPDGMVYASWWELTTYTSPAPFTYQYDWHLIKLDPSDDSYVELGTGQHAVDVGTGTDEITANTDITLGIWANGIAVSENGDVFVSTAEQIWIGSHPGGSSYRRPYIWRWNGSTWTDLAIPDPSVVNGSNPGAWSLGFENQFWDLLVPIIPYRNNGLVSDGFTIIFNYGYFETINHNATVTRSYTVGSGWGSEINTDWDAILGDLWFFYDGGASPWPYSRSLEMIDPTIMWSEQNQRLMLCCDFIGPWAVFQMNDSGDAWEHVEPEVNGIVAMNWNQSRNTAAIGPDGNIFRAMMADPGTGNTNWFSPKIGKYSPGFGPGYTNGSRYACGELGEFYASMYATQNVPIQIVGNYAYILYNLFTESYYWASGDERYADGWFVFKCPYIPCSGPINLTPVQFRAWMDQEF